MKVSLKHTPYIFLFFVLLIGHSRSAMAQCAPFAEFTYTITNDGYTVLFNSEACDDDLIYAWSFGDGASSSAEDPTHIYSDEGTYIVTMTVQLPPPCTASYTQTATIIIHPSAPGSMWLDLTGPTLAGECQQVFFNAQVTGGVPPYTYVWEMGDAYRPAGCPTGDPGPTSFNGVANQVATFRSTAPSANTVCVTVYDANGDHERKCLEIKVQDFIYPPEIYINGTKNGSCYVPNSNIVFLPDIDPLTAFEYPTNYLWDFGDGTTYLDNIDGGGVAVHTYATPPNGNITYTVKLTVSDPNGSMQATKPITVCGTGGGGGGSGCRLEISGMPQSSTITMDYAGQPSNYPSGAYFDYINDAQPGCSDPIYRWSVSMPTCGLYGLLTGATDFNGLEIGSGFPMTIGDNDWYVLTQGYKAWGCLRMVCTESGTNPNGNACTPCTNGNDCIAYILPDELILSDIKVEGSCQTYDLSAQVLGGGWKLENGMPKYKNYTWTAYDINNPDQEINVLTAAPGNPADKRRVNLNDPYFKQFGPNQYVEFMVKLIVEDYANNIVETNQLISFDPFRLHLEDTYSRCAGVTSHFSDQPLASGGSGGPYVFTWSGGLTGENPVFTAPLHGSATYSVTVSDGSCTLTKTITVNVTPLDFDWTYSPWSICGITGREIGLNEGYLADVPLGGSGNYSFEWSTANPNHLAYLSDIHSAHPYASGIPVGQTITYTLTITDIMGGCTASDDFVINSIANTHTAFFDPTSINLCYGEETVLIPKVSPIDNTPPWGNVLNFYKWSTTNPNHDLSEVPTYMSQLPIDEVVASHPSPNNAPFIYTLRYDNIVTGCFAEASVNVTIGNLWKHVGYNPLVKSIVSGSAADLWSPGTTNKITQGISNLNNIEITWWPHDPNSVTLNPNTHLPSNGIFMPTIDAPYLVMTVTDKATGCSKSYKTIRYIVAGATPELWASPSNTFTCVGGEVCFDVVFDAHVVNNPNSLLPSEISVRCVLKSPVFFPSQDPMQPDKIRVLTLQLVNSSGLYKGSFCEDEYFLNNTNFGNNFYHMQTSLIGNAAIIWNNVPTYDVLINIFSGNAPNNNVQRCNPTLASSLDFALQFTFGVLPCNGPSGNICSDGGFSAITMARDFIKIQPDANLEIVPSANNIGRRFVINPCIAPHVQAPDPEALLQAPSTADRTEEMVSTTVNSEATLEVFPNPFTNEVTIQYTLPSDCGEEARISLYDIAGQHLQTIEKRKSSGGGQFEIIFNGKHLPPGVYFYELAAGNCRKIKKAIKIGF